MLVNGKQTTFISAHDRGLAYGDGVFETIRVAGGRAHFLQEHFDRLFRGCERLGIVPPKSSQLDADVRQALSLAGEEAIIKIIVTRGEGKRGYRPSNTTATRVVSWATYEPPSVSEVSLHMCEGKLAINPQLAGIKHLNRLEQVMAAAEIPGSYFEGLVCDMEGFPVEGTRSNIFMVSRGVLRTPLVDRCGVDGVLRRIIVDEHSASEERLSMEELYGADELFICNSVFGVLPVVSIDASTGSIRFERGSVTKDLRDEFRERVS
jgi:4-amino-4-deoxychorismate lyase